MKYSLILPLLFLFTLGHAQSDSLSIKLNHYKELYNKGLIDSVEYRSLRRSAIGLGENSKSEIKPQTIIVQQIAPTVKNDSLALDDYQRGLHDALVHYNKAGNVFFGTFVCTFLTGPIIGLAPAIGCGSSFNEDNANYPDRMLSKNPDYRIGYIHECRREKRKAAWSAWGVGFGMDIIVGTLVGVLVTHANK